MRQQAATSGYVFLASRERKASQQYSRKQGGRGRLTTCAVGGMRQSFVVQCDEHHTHAAMPSRKHLPATLSVVLLAVLAIGGASLRRHSPPDDIPLPFAAGDASAGLGS